MMMIIIITCSPATPPPLVCPHCSNILTVSPSPDTGRNRLECRTCPYQCAIEAPLFSRRTFKRKEREDVFGGPGAWDNADKTAVQCPAAGCNGNEAAFYQIQIRSADEPMTSFFKVRVPLSCLVSSCPALPCPRLLPSFVFADPPL